MEALRGIQRELVMAGKISTLVLTSLPPLFRWDIQKQRSQKCLYGFRHVLGLGPIKTIKCQSQGIGPKC